MPLGTREAKFWGQFKDGMRHVGQKNGFRILIDRIESGMTGRGIPDIHMTDPELGDCWIELKVAKGNTINLTPLQAKWLTERSKAGCRCRIMALVVGSRDSAIRIWDGSQAHSVRDNGLHVLGTNLLEPFDWGEVRTALFWDKASDYVEARKACA